MTLKEQLTYFIRKDIQTARDKSEIYQKLYRSCPIGSEAYLENYKFYNFYQGELRGLREAFVYVQCMKDSDVLEDGEVLR